MVSEDSQEFGWFPTIHRLSNLRYRDDPCHRHVLAHIHHSDDLGELLKVLAL